MWMFSRKNKSVIIAAKFCQVVLWQLMILNIYFLFHMLYSTLLTAKVWIYLLRLGHHTDWCALRPYASSYIDIAHRFWIASLCDVLKGSKAVHYPCESCFSPANMIVGLLNVTALHLFPPSLSLLNTFLPKLIQ